MTVQQELLECQQLLREINRGGEPRATNEELAFGARKSPLPNLKAKWWKTFSKGKWVHSDYGKSRKLTTV